MRELSRKMELTNKQRYFGLAVMEELCQKIEHGPLMNEDENGEPTSDFNPGFF